MQQFYKSPEIFILKIGEADVITASGNPADTDPGKDDLDWLGV